MNGVETDTNHLSAIKSGNARLFIGQDGWGQIFNGVVDEVKIYNRALTAEEIKADYEAGLEDITPPPNITSFASESPVYDDEGAARTFNITVNQTVNVTEVQFNESVTAADYTNASAAVIGTWNVSASADNTTTGLADMQTWDWIVTAPGSYLVGELTNINLPERYHFPGVF